MVGNSGGDMDDSNCQPTPVAFDRFVFDPERRTLSRDGEAIVLQGKAFELLAILVGSRSVPVSRQSLYDRLWPNTVVEDGNLTQAVYLLRRALDPCGNGRRFIETVPRFGYRFAMPINGAERTALVSHHRPRGWFAIPAVAACAALLLFSGSAF